VALCERFRTRAKTFMREAEEAARSARLRDTVRLAAMASTLHRAAWELSFCGRISPTAATARTAEGAQHERRLYRLAHREPAGEYTRVGRAYLSLDAAGVGAGRQNAIRKEFGLPKLTHAAIYEEIEISDLTQPPTR
jgi:hypothetical protein